MISDFWAFEYAVSSACSTFLIVTPKPQLFLFLLLLMLQDSAKMRVSLSSLAWPSNIWKVTIRNWKDNLQSGKKIFENIFEILTPKVMGLEGEGFGKYLSHEVLRPS